MHQNFSRMYIIIADNTKNKSEQGGKNMKPGRRKGIRKKYKRLVAAVAGTAVMSATMWHGIPLPKAYAADNTDYGAVSKGDWQDVKNKINGTVDYAAINDPVKLTTEASSAYRLGDPVYVVKRNAYRYGFDPVHDKFTLLTQSGAKATVEVRTSGQTFKVDLVQNRGKTWTITTIRGIGNSRYPATYYPASLFESRPGLPVGAGQQTLYQTSSFSGWIWRETRYPRDMTFGAFSQDPRLRGTGDPIPDDVLGILKNVNFRKQIVLYAHLGTVGPRNYGIGIETITQLGNDLIVTVRTKSPLPGEKETATKAYDYITIDRSSLQPFNLIRVTFIDQNGSILSGQMINAR